MSNKFKVGDIVQLKSGGPAMTVSDIPAGMRSVYSAQWFAGKKLERGNFDEDSMQTYVPPTTSSSASGSSVG